MAQRPTGRRTVAYLANQLGAESATGVVVAGRTGSEQTDRNRRCRFVATPR